MTKNIEQFDLQVLLRCCDSTLDGLNEFSDRLVKIIKVKQEAASSTSSNVAFSQGQDFLEAIANLKKINEKLPGAIGEIKQLCQQVLLLTQQFGLRSESESNSTGVPEPSEKK